MEHLLLKAAMTAADQGIFEAVISTATADREKDVVSPEGMVRALHKWNRNIPLAWNHSTKAEDQIGYVEPQSARVDGGEVVVKGFIDQNTPVGADAWRQVKNGTLGFSFGYMILAGSNRKGGGRNIDELDVFEVTATNTPMNNDTRVLSFKAMSDPQAQHVQSMMTAAQSFIDNETDQQDIAQMRQAMTILRRLMGMEQTEPPDSDDSGKSLRHRAEAVEFEHVAGDAKAIEPAPEVNDLPDEAAWLFPDWALEAARSGEFKAVWTTAFINNLPDSAFLYIEDGGSKDDEGKTTPRSLRHFPYKDSGGAVDLPHLRNALSRIPQSSLPQNIKDRLTSKAQAILDAQKSVDAAGKETKSRPADPLRKLADAVALDYASDGASRRKPPQKKEAPKPQPELDLKELKRRTREEMLTHLSGVTEHESL